METLQLNNCAVEFTDNNMVRIRFTTDVGTSIKYITFDELCNMVLASRENKKDKIVEVDDTPELPAFGNIKTVKYRKTSEGIQYVFLSREPVPADIIYFDNKFKNVGMPKLLFSVRIYKNIIQTAYVVAVKDAIITEDTALFCYPFSNAPGSNQGRICFGSNNISSIDVTPLVNLHSLPDMFLSIPNNNDGYGYNLSGLDYRPMLEKLRGKPFTEDWLKPMKQNFKEWIRNMK